MCGPPPRRQQRSARCRMGVRCRRDWRRSGRRSAAVCSGTAGYWLHGWTALTAMCGPVLRPRITAGRRQRFNAPWKRWSVPWGAGWLHSPLRWRRWRGISPYAAPRQGSPARKSGSGSSRRRCMLGTARERRKKATRRAVNRNPSVRRVRRWAPFQRRCAAQCAGFFVCGSLPRSRQLCSSTLIP